MKSLSTPDIVLRAKEQLVSLMHPFDFKLGRTLRKQRSTGRIDNRRFVPEFNVASLIGKAAAEFCEKS